MPDAAATADEKRLMEQPQVKLVFTAPSRLAPAPVVAPPAHELLAMLTDHLGAGVTVIGTDLRFLYANAVFATWFALRPEQLVGASIDEIYGDQARTNYMPYFERALAGETLRYQGVVRSPAGRDEWHTICLSPCFDAQGKVTAITSAALDVRTLQAKSEALRTADQRLSFHIDNSPLAVIEVDSALNITHCSRRATELFGWDAARVRGQALHPLLNTTGESPAPLCASLARLRDGTESSNRSETTHTNRNGATLHCAWFNSALTDAAGSVVSIMSLVEDVSARVQAARQMREMAERDPLTGLYNRSVFQMRLESSLARARRAGGAVALLYVDLDGFKRVNDTLGHRAGDAVLRAAAQRLLGVVRESDTLARLGGDEFVVLLDADVQPSVIEALSSRMIAALAAPFMIGSHFATIGASIGVALQPAEGGHADRLITRADEALYEAKRAGKGCVRHASVD